MPIDDSKLAKRATQLEMHDRVAKPGFQPVGKFSADKSASHHEKAEHEEHNEQMKHIYFFERHRKPNEQHQRQATQQ